MKRTVALFLSLLFMFGTANVGAEKIWSADRSYESDEATGIWISVPLAETMRKLGYEVSYKDGIVTSSKKYETQEVKFILDVPKALFYYTVNGEKFDGRLYFRPKIYNGITYVDRSFFNNYVSKFENVDCVREWAEKDIVSIYKYDKEKAELNKSYDAIKKEYEKYGIIFDNKSETEYSAKMTFDTNLSCEKLGINISGGGYLNSDLYSNPEKEVFSVSMTGNVSGIFNIIKLANGKPLDESKEISVSVYADKKDVYVKQNIEPDESVDEKWTHTPNVMQFNENIKYDEIGTLVDMIFESKNIEGEAKERLYHSITNLIPFLQKKVSFLEEDGKVYVKSEYVKEDIREAIRLFINEFPEIKSEDMKAFEKFFEDSEFSIISSDVYEKGRLLSSDADVKMKMVIEIPDANISVNYQVNMKAEIVGGKSNAIKTAPALNEVYFGDSV